MAEKKYLNLEGLQDVANHVNTRLKTVTTIPASADDGAVRLYVGETGVTYKKGHIYQYNATDLEWVDITSSNEYTAGNGIDITDNEISVETYIFTGTQAQWDALTTDQKKEYDICNITDDVSSDDEIYTKSEIDAMLGTAASKDATDVVRPNDHDLVESNAVYAAINNALSSVYTPRGDLTCAELTSALLVEQNVGNVYQMTDSGTTSALFINGAGHTINVNDNVGIIKAGQDTYLFNLMGNAFDLHDYQKKDLETPITIGGVSRTTVEGALGALNDVDATKANLTQISNPNLLDNPWFTINQRGQTAYLGTSRVYTVDRWLKDGGLKVEVQSDESIKIYKTVNGNNAIVQVLETSLVEKLNGRVVTASMIAKRDGSAKMRFEGTNVTGDFFDLSSDYKLYSMTFTLSKNDSGVWNFFPRFATEDYANDAVYIKAVKLELGAVSTLAMDTAPNTATELLKCQRYFQRIWQKTTTDTLCIAVQRSSTILRTVIPLTVPMRLNPTVTISGTVSDYTNSGLTMAKISGVVENGGIVGVNFNITKSGVTWNDGTAKSITPDANDFYIDFSADL